jgi:hypothetical protein
MRFARRNTSPRSDSSTPLRRSIQVVLSWAGGVRGRIIDVGCEPGDGTAGGIAAWHSHTHTEPEQIGELPAEFARCRRPAGSLLIGFFDGVKRDPSDHAVTTESDGRLVTWPRMSRMPGSPSIRRHRYPDAHRPGAHVFTERSSPSAPGERTVIVLPRPSTVAYRRPGSSASLAVGAWVDALPWASEPIRLLPWRRG